MGSTQKYFYSMLAEASAAAIALGVTTKSEYRKKRYLDPRLPSDPSCFYKEEWQGWPSFLGKHTKSIHPTLAEASAAAKTLRIATITEFQEKRNLDPQTPSFPPHIYKEEWRGWPSFLGEDTKSFYSTSAEASAAAIALGVTTKIEYREKRHLDPQTPTFPPHIYKEEWQGWASFLSKF